MVHKSSVIPAFKSAAEELLKNSGLSAVELLAKALAKAVVSTLSLLFNYIIFFFRCIKTTIINRFSYLGKCYLQGYTDVKKRSLLTSMENYVTLLLEGGKPMFTPS
jgi:ATP-dependent RNA helicase DDX21